MSKQASPALVGGFVVTGVALVIAAVFVLGGRGMFHHRARVIVYFDGTVAGLRVGAPVKFRGIDIGAVEDIRINMPGAIQDPVHVRIPVVLAIDEDQLRSQGVDGFKLDRERLRHMVVSGLRAELASESLVTGILYVALDVQPDTPITLSGTGRYPEIPSVRSARETIPSKIEDVLTNLARVDFAKVADSANAALSHADRLLANPELDRAVTRLESITQRADRLLLDLDSDSRQLAPALTELERTATSARTALAPAGSLARRIDAALSEIESAARSLRRLADHIDRDPGALIRGGRP